MKVFIDANILLSHLQSEDAAILKELKKLIKSNKVTLLVPEQLKQEYSRNLGQRITSIADGYNKLVKRFPRQSSENKEKEKQSERSEKISRKVKQIETIIDKTFAKEIKEWEKFVKEEKALAVKRINTNNELIQEILSLGDPIKEDEFIIARAERRFLKGNPPRKLKENENIFTTSYGDAINWESLLERADDQLTIISKDLDYCEPSETGLVINRLLKEEWEEKTKLSKNKNSVYLEQSIGSFIKNSFKIRAIKKSVLDEEKELSSQPIEGLPVYRGFENWLVKDAQASAFGNVTVSNPVVSASSVLGTVGIGNPVIFTSRRITCKTCGAEYSVPNNAAPQIGNIFTQVYPCPNGHLNV
ncbi:MAG TPA: PIN domain-containing protein [Patescibacteria group bacterium]|nr:PIN domain-containing protein [Patescibacteria group bacterium]